MQKLQNQKCRICRRLGTKLFLKGKHCYEKCPIDRAGAIPPGVHGRKFSRPTFYSEQLKEKQRLKAIYGLTEAQLKVAFTNARSAKGEPTDERLRLDNVVYRLGFAPNRRTARQLVSHGKILVNGRKVTIPSCLVGVKEVISLADQAQDIPQVKQTLSEETSLPSWLKKKALVGTIKNLPKKEEVEIDANIASVIEFYSR
jgi:small subunit ribosomal protein S4